MENSESNAAGAPRGITAPPPADASRALADVSAGQAAARQAASKPTWFTGGMAVVAGLLVAISPFGGPLVAVVVFLLLAVEIGLFVAWHRTSTVRVRPLDRLRPWRVSISIMVGMLVLLLGGLALLNLPSWSTGTLAWLSPACGIVVAVIAFAVSGWRSRQWASMPQ